MICNTGPICSSSKYSSDIAKGKLSEDTQGKDLLIRFGQLVENLVNDHSLLAIVHLFFYGASGIRYVQLLDIQRIFFLP